MSDFRQLVYRALEAIPPPDPRGRTLEVPPELAPLALARLPAALTEASGVVVTATMAEADALAAELQQWLGLLGLDTPSGSGYAQNVVGDLSIMNEQLGSIDNIFIPFGSGLNGHPFGLPGRPVPTGFRFGQGQGKNQLPLGDLWK